MARFEDTIDVDVPLRTAYNQWTQFEEFPRFMEGVKEVRQQGDTNLHWKAEVGGKDQEWDARITKQEPDQVVAWTSTSGDPNSGTVKFQQLAPDKTRVMLEVNYEPEGMTEKAGDKLGFMGRRLTADLKRFKEFIEGRGMETGAWRGSVHKN
jgi:uncharacterized membrane protein